MIATLRPYQEKIEKKLQESILTLGPPNTLREACSYALLTPGKRIRPAIVLLIAEALGQGKEVMEGALATEFFHTASLIADDLPCMDNDGTRRERPTVHKAYGETIALLATYTLISAGYEKIRLNAPRGEMLSLALQSATYTTGIFGATGGQYIDLFPPPPSRKVLEEIIYKKTTALFELSFVLGWLLGGGEIEKIDHVKRIAAHFGAAFQLADDFADMEQDKAQGCLNAVHILGPEAARLWLEEEQEGFVKLIGELPFDPSSLLTLMKP